MSQGEEKDEEPQMSPAAAAAAATAAPSRVAHGGDSESSSSSSSSSLPEKVLNNVLLFLTSRHDRNSFSLVCKSWYKAEALTRSELFISNCYAISPQRAIKRFPRIKSLMLKGKPRFADFNYFPVDWGAHFNPWLTSMASAYPWLEKIHLKRMLLTDSDLFLLAQLLPQFKELVLEFCEGFGTYGLAAVASSCRKLRVLDLIEVIMDDDCEWISCFPETETCLECLVFDCAKTPVDFIALEQLVARSPSLKKLKVNQYVTIEQLRRLMVLAPQLTDLGAGSFNCTEPMEQLDQQRDLSIAFANCSSLVSLSGFSDILPDYVHTIYPVCANLLSLNFSYTTIKTGEFKSLISRCHKLQTLWVLDTIGDEGLYAVAATCKELRELRVFPVNVHDDGEAIVSEEGLLLISEGCKKLRKILYFCQTMTNAALVAMSRNFTELTVFRLFIMGLCQPDHLTDEPMDEGFGAIVMNCKKLRRLSVSGQLTDNAFSYIGKYGKSLRTISIGFAGDSDRGLRYLLEECPKLAKLEIRDGPFGDTALLSGLPHYYDMRFLWMSSCKLSLDGCKEVARRMPQLVVEIFKDPYAEDNCKAVDRMYLYRSLEGRRSDTPESVSIL